VVVICRRHLAAITLQQLERFFMTHTTGPWTCNSGRIYGTSKEYPIAEIFDIYIEDEEATANARLIAAAPELLSFAEATAQTFGADTMIGTEARKVIAKARGQA
jgi:hypothetical protein